MTDTPDNTPDNPEPETPDNPEPETPDAEEQDTWTPPDKDTYEKLQRKAAQRDKLLREAQAKIKELSGTKDKPEEPSEADKLRDGIKRTAARAVLAGAGVTDKDDQATLLEVLRLDGVEIGEDGEADTDALEERLTDLRRILGTPASTPRPRPKVTARDLGGPKAEPADPDKARRIRFLTGRAG